MDKNSDMIKSLLSGHFKNIGAVFVFWLGAWFLSGVLGWKDLNYLASAGITILLIMNINFGLMLLNRWLNIKVTAMKAEDKRAAQAAQAKA